MILYVIRETVYGGLIYDTKGKGRTFENVNFEAEQCTSVKAIWVTLNFEYQKTNACIFDAKVLYKQAKTVCVFFCHFD
jgi:hypothetical protein